MNTKHAAPAFQVYAAEELADLYGVTTQARGIYTTLRARCWLRRGLPTAPRELAKLAGVPYRSFRAPWAEIAELFTRRGGRLVLAKLFALQQEYDARAAERSASGTMGAAKRWGKHVPEKPRSIHRVLVRMAHSVMIDGKLLDEYADDLRKGNDVGLFKEFQLRASGARLLPNAEDDPAGYHDRARSAWNAAKQQRNKSQLRLRGLLVAVKGGRR